MTERLKQISARLGPTSRCLAGPFTLRDLDLRSDDRETTQALADLRRDDLIAWQDGAETLTVKNPNRVGAVELVRSFCKKNYGITSPLVPRALAQAILRRHGADYDIDAPDVRADLEKLAAEGYIRVLDSDRAFFKMLGE